MAYDRKDHFHQRAKREGFRSRAAYKLLEIQGTYRVLRPGDRVVDLGCWPGSWLQVAREAVGADGRVVGVDLVGVDPPLPQPNAIALQGDLAEPAVCEAIREQLGGPADVLLSDAAPKLSGSKAADRAREEALLEAIEGHVPRLLRRGGSLLMKLLDCPEAEQVAVRLAKCFEAARRVKPRASRRGTRERYLLARRYRGASGF